MKSTQSISAILILAILLVGNGGIAGAPERFDHVGTYILIKVNNQPLPVVVSDSGSMKQEVIGGLVILRSDKTHRWETVYRHTESGNVHTDKSSGRGRYSINGDLIRFKFDGNEGHMPGTIKHGILTIPTDAILQYKKQAE